MTTELRPPPEYAHLEYHWLKFKLAPEHHAVWHWNARTEQWLGAAWDNHQPPSYVGRSLTYHSPCIPLVADDATVERVAGAIAGSLGFDSGSYRAARAAIAELLRVDPPK
jgi:hypothetical protein